MGSFVYVTYLGGSAIHQVASSALLSFLREQLFPIPTPGDLRRVFLEWKIKTSCFHVEELVSMKLFGNCIVLLHRFPYGQRSTNGLVLFLCRRVFPTSWQCFQFN
ncbi:hypothetical protein CDAR_319641 [Caerostris darwini]|uniref:Uncharacterized protein n=1 Tax=Caerostris darwini TaxID=1538125 RepID=A0AAV4M7A5_9ARAC|nr:hypothetical protein CDAR_319641 [Caerostris darwini]